MKRKLMFNGYFIIDLTLAVYRSPVHPRTRNFRPIKRRTRFDKFRYCKNRITPLQKGLRDRINYFHLNEGIIK